MATTRDTSDTKFQAYLDLLARAVGHADRREPLRAYLTDPCLPGERKSVEPMAARIDPRHVRSRHQSMHHFVADAPWEDAAVLRVARDTVLTQMERHGAVVAWVVDDTGFPKKGTRSEDVPQHRLARSARPPTNSHARRGTRSRGDRARAARCARASPACACAPPIATPSGRNNVPTKRW